MTQIVEHNDKSIRPFKGTILGWFSIEGLSFALVAAIFILILTYSGFEAGEKGIMIGIFASTVLFAFLGSIGFLIIMLWAEIKCIKHPFNQTEAEKKETA